MKLISGELRLVIEYDPWGDSGNAKRAQAAFQTLGIPVELREVRKIDLAPARMGAVKFAAVSEIPDADPK